MPQAPRQHSPLASLARKILLFGVAPLIVLGLLFYGMVTYKPGAYGPEARAVQELRQKLEASTADDRAQTQALIDRLKKDPVAIRNEAEMKGMTPEQRAVRRRELEVEWKRKNGYQ